MNAHPSLIDNTAAGPLIDRVTPRVDLLTFCTRHDLQVVLETHHNSIRATLVGLYLYHPSCNDGPAYSDDIATLGDTKEQALRNLASVCSGRPYCREKHEADWSILFGANPKPDGTFPALVYRA